MVWSAVLFRQAECRLPSEPLQGHPVTTSLSFRQVWSFQVLQLVTETGGHGDDQRPIFITQTDTLFCISSISSPRSHSG